ncbi:hypothetical protein ONS95_003969 [Cadophora gregata]|uniref:uncharacterized protein n=1 Tax=Cadophora gregata TaxID=51156 RepID=UPI0026DC79D1|nr:uncharacterized protein ONS95_003969 [Cadophora gregata]KAK0107269.1 hypothetical protein ONS95_003969 [Cadophora gregata]KAK0116952.1 hypothetical protein ONS96_012796 [Cadophora gregata f. sp. sojae]
MSAPEVVSNGVGSSQKEATVERDAGVIQAEGHDEALPEDPEKANQDAIGSPEDDNIHPENSANLLESVHEDPEKEEIAGAIAAQDRARARAEKEDEIRPLSQVDPNAGDPSASSDFMGEDATTVDGMESTVDGLDDPKAAPIPPIRPPLEKLAQKNPKPTDHLSITLGPFMIILFDVVVPIIIYYAWYNTRVRQRNRECRRQNQPIGNCSIVQIEYDEEILGYAVISFGFGELYILIVRVARLLRYRELCAPLLSRSKWELDATSWVYGVSMICALIPFVVGSTLEIPQLYLYSPGFLMAFLGCVMLISVFPIPLPIGINSHARGTPMRPFIYYAAEDFIAVDGLQDREFRVRYNARYDSSKAFRRMFTYLTWWWISGVIIYLGCLSAVIWKLRFHYAFGLSLGVLFAYLTIWALASYYFVMWSMHREKMAWERGASA